MRAEVRGRGRKWKVFYEDEGGIPTEHLVFGKDGTVRRTVKAGAPTRGMVEAFGGPFTSAEDAEDYARYLGATEVKAVRTSSRAESLAKARKARRKEAVPA